MILQKSVIFGPLAIALISGFGLAAPAHSTSGTASSSQPPCRNVQFLASGSAENRNFSNTPLDDPETLTAAVLADKFDRIEIKGKQVISGLFCEPKVKNSNNGRLQIAVSQIVGNRNYWNALGDYLSVEPYQPQNYSWVNKDSHQTASPITVMCK